MGSADAISTKVAPKPSKVPTSKPPLPSSLLAAREASLKHKEAADKRISAQQTIKPIDEGASRVILRAVAGRVKKTNAVRRRNIDSIICKVCEGRYPSRKHYEDHLETRCHKRLTDPKEYKCIPCNLAFISQEDLELHSKGK